MLYRLMQMSHLTLVDGPMNSGNYTLQVLASEFAQGVYTATLRVKTVNEDVTRTIKLIVTN
jgi:hypothetical protein